jgi:hypothetical protein
MRRAILAVIVVGICVVGSQAARQNTTEAIGL